MDSLTTTANSQRRALLEQDRQMLRRLVAEWRTVAARIDQEVARLSTDAALSRTWLYERERLTILRITVQAHIQRYVLLLEQEIVTAITTQQAVDDALDLIKAAIDAPLIVPIGPTEQLIQLRPLLESLAPQAAQAVADALIQGVALGQGPREIARAIRKVANLTLNRALTIARTETLRAYRATTLRAYRANREVVTGWIWLAAHSPRTCAMCLAMSGTKHTLDEEMRSHPNCRCVMVPITETVIQIESGIDWFARQTGAVQKGILGPGKFKAYQNSTLALSDLVGTKQTAAYGAVRYEKPLKEVAV